MSSDSEYIPPTFLTEKQEDEFFSDKDVYGLRNYGNTCFMNSIIQCLNQTTEFTKYIVSLDYYHDLKKDDEIENDIQSLQKRLTNDWYRLQRAMWNTKMSLGPKSFHQTIQILSMKSGRIEFVGHHQKDATEFFEFLMENFHMATCGEVDFEIEGEPKHKWDKMALVAAESWSKFFKKEYSKIVELFYGQYHCTITCPECTYKSTTYQPFLTLQVPVPFDKPVVSLKECLSLFNREETLDLDNQWKCENCKDYRKAQKKISIWSTPQILTIQLKRFTKDKKKINNRVEFPLDSLSLNDYSIGYGREKATYSLYAIVNHNGDTGGGHYYSFVKKWDGTWCIANDAMVSRISEKDLITNSAYMLFYRKIE